VVPVAAATMTPLPLTLALCYFKIREHFFDEQRQEVVAVDEPEEKAAQMKDLEALAEQEEEEETFKQSESSHKLILRDQLEDKGRVC